MSFDNVSVEMHLATFTTAPESDMIMMTPVVADLNEDGTPDIIFTTYQGGVAESYYRGAVLRAVDGKTGGELWTVNDPDRKLSGGSSIAVGDIDSDGDLEVIAVRNRYGLVVFDGSDGSHVWDWDGRGFVNFGGPALADLEGDGKVEIVVGHTVLDSNKVVRWSHEPASGTPEYQRQGTVSLVADLDMDGTAEVVAGSVAYRADGSVYYQTSMAASFPAVGNFDSDPFPEIVLVESTSVFNSPGAVYLIEHDGTVKWGPVAIPQGGGGPPMIADVDGDGEPEIGVGSSFRYTVFETDGTIKWSMPINDPTSLQGGSSAFDFDGDGKFEVLYADQTTMFVFNGEDGSILYQRQRNSGTAYELPVVVDSDADGQAEILIGVNSSTGLHKGLYILGDPTWLGTRQIWNQYTYHITNVNDDGTIPTNEQPSWLQSNTYRSNPTLAAGIPTPYAPNLQSTSDTPIPPHPGFIAGTTDTDNITSDTSPTFNVGNIAASSKVELLRNGAVVATLLNVGPGTVALTDPGVPANGNFIYTARQYAAGGQVSALSAELQVTIDSTLPAAPSAPDLQAGSDTGSSSTDNVTSDSTPTFDIGNSVANATLQLLRDGVVVATLVNVGPGIVAIMDPAAPLGTFTYTARQFDLAGNASTSSAGLSVTIASQPPLPPPSNDFDGDGKSDASVFQPNNNPVRWSTWLSQSQTRQVTTFGLRNDIPVSADFNGDGKAELAVYRPVDSQGVTGQWFVAGQTTRVAWWGGSTDIPVPADYNGDGTTEVAIFRPSTAEWIISTMPTALWGGSNFIPVSGDFDGDGKDDIAVYTPTANGLQWHVRSSAGIAIKGNGGLWGAPNDIPVPADYDGDGKTDIAIYNIATARWYINASSTPLSQVPWWGGAGDLPVPDDYDGDGKADIAVYRASTGQYFIQYSGGGAAFPTPDTRINGIPVQAPIIFRAPLRYPASVASASLTPASVTSASVTVPWQPGANATLPESTLTTTRRPRWNRPQFGANRLG